MADILAVFRGALAEAGFEVSADTDMARILNRVAEAGVYVDSVEKVKERDAYMRNDERKACAEIAENAKALYLGEAMKATEPKPDGEPTDVVLGWDQIFLRYANVASTIAENIKER